MKWCTAIVAAAFALLPLDSRAADDVYFECFGNEYKLETTLKSWNNHKSWQGTNSDGWLLASIRNPEEDECIKDALEQAGYSNLDNIWLGGKVKNISTREWKWTDNDSSATNFFQNWGQFIVIFKSLSQK